MTSRPARVIILKPCHKTKRKKKLGMGRGVVVGDTAVPQGPPQIGLEASPLLSTLKLSSIPLSNTQCKVPATRLAGSRKQAKEK